MSVLDNLLDEFMFQDASSIFEKSEKELLNDILREEQLSTDDDEILINQGLHGKIGDI